MTLWYDMAMRTALVTMLWLSGTALAAANDLRLRLPVTCELGSDCFLQQLPDMDSGPGARDPFCRSATYDGHKGTDIRLPRLEDIDRNVAVVASAGGTVKGLRDGEPDRLIAGKADAEAVRDRECGNGVVISHEGGWETQYCHLKRGSVAVRSGDRVKAGDRLGSIGASGMAQFPHVHLSVRRNGQDIDPFTGWNIGEGCRLDGNRAGRLWDREAATAIDVEPAQVIATGFAAGVVEHEALGLSLPEVPNEQSAALVGWAYFINLEKGDRVAVTISGPDGKTFARNLSEPLDRAKAAYSIYAGKRGKPARGLYTVEAMILRDSEAMAARRKELRIE